MHLLTLHYGYVIMGAIASQITSLTIVYSTVYLDADQITHQSSASLAFVRGIHRGPVNSPHKWPVTREMFPVDDVIMVLCKLAVILLRYPSQFIEPIRCTTLRRLSSGTFFNSSVPGRFERNFRRIIFKLNFVINGWGISCQIPHEWLSLDLTDDKLTLVQVTASYRQATIHSFIQCWPRSMPQCH